jgi:hypothetical protein
MLLARPRRQASQFDLFEKLAPVVEGYQRAIADPRGGYPAAEHVPQVVRAGKTDYAGRARARQTVPWLGCFHTSKQLQS